MSDAPAHAVVLGPEAPALRRALGPTAWAVLETTLTVGHRSGGRLVADVSVRELAEALGVAKNTAAHAVLTLRRAGILTPTQARSSDGAFARGRYAIDVPGSALELFAAPFVAVPTPRPRRRGSLLVEQLALLPE